MKNINPNFVLRDKIDHVSSFLSTSAGIKLVDYSYFLYGSSVIHALLESKRKKVNWTPQDVDLVFHNNSSDFDAMVKQIQSIKKISVNKVKKHNVNTYHSATEYNGDWIEDELKSVSVTSYALDYEINLINDPRHYTKSRGSFVDSIFKTIDLATLSCVYDPIENEVYLSELAGDAIAANELVLNPHFIRKFVLFLERNEPEIRLQSPSFSVLQNMAIRTITRVKKYKERGFKIGNETIEELKILREFADEFK